MRARFENGIYRDCKWCRGRGCLACPAEADKEYRRQFPDGPKPILTITREEIEQLEVEHGAVGGVLGEVLKMMRSHDD